ncbi:MAG: hypothetical protein ACJAYU_005401 [Bradymonadia bacterium]|jgi:hypothetical protein
MYRNNLWPLLALAVLAPTAIGCGDDDAESDPTTDAATDADPTEADATDVAPEDLGTDTVPDPDTEDDAEDVEPDIGPDAEPDTEPDTEPDADVEPDTPDFSDWDHQTRWIGPELEWDRVREADGSLAAKAAYFDWIVPALHQVPTDAPGHEDWSRVYHATCEADVPTEIVADEDLPICTFNLNENNGLWTGLYVASQAYRYAATGDAEALEQVLRTLRGTRRMMDITGTQGLYTRDFRDPSLPQHACPSNPMEYVPPGSDMVGNRWVMVGDDGCFRTWDPDLAEGAGDWVRDADHCTSDEYAGFCWQRNGSKDELSGHLYAATLVAKLVDDPEAQSLALGILEDVIAHLIANEFWITDYDGRPTRYGSAHALSLDHIPGFNALLALSWTRSAASVTQDTEIIDFYEGCLLDYRDTDDCIDATLENGTDYRTYLTDFALLLGCQTNYDNVNIGMLSYAGLMLMEPNPELVETYRNAFHRGSRGPDPHGRNLWQQGNAFWNFTLTELMGADPEEPETAIAMVHDGIVSLYDFHPNNIRRDIDNIGVEVECVSDRHGNLAAAPMPVNQRCSNQFEWWGDPAQIENCTARPNFAQPPAGYLLPYWMARYNGFITDEM